MTKLSACAGMMCGAALLAACSAAPPARAPEPMPVPAPAPHPQLAPVVEQPAPPAVLAAVSAEPLQGRGYAQLGMAGRNKPNGVQYRLRQDVLAETPPYVARQMAGLELWIADRTADGWMAFYRGPLGGNPDGRNVAYRAVLHRPDGSRAGNVDLGRFLSRRDRLEIQDVRYADGALYFNEACQSYSREAGGACSALVRIDPARGTELWRTGPLTSNNVFIVRGPYIIAGYGFTAEADSLFLIDRATGRVLSRQGLDSAHGYLEFVGDELVVITNERVHRFRIQPR